MKAGHVMTNETGRGSRSTPDLSKQPSRHRGNRLAWSVGIIAVGTISIALIATQLIPPTSFASTNPTNCAAAPSKCGYPDATNSGVLAGTVLKTVPAQVSSGPGWTSTSDGSVHVTGNSAVVAGLYIPGTLDISANNVTVKNVKIVTDGNFGISLRHITGVTIQNTTIAGENADAGRLNYGIDDVFGDSTGMVIKNDNISLARTAIQVSSGQITGNYIHDPGFIAGDHTNGIYVNGNTKPLTISGNTIFNNLTQTDDINLDASGALGQAVANKIVTGNLLAGGGYSIYGGAALRAATSNIVIRGNSFSDLYYANGGKYGPISYFNSHGSGNVWSGNVWSGLGRPDASVDQPGLANVIPSP
jgi:hypothetical protein